MYHVLQYGLLFFSIWAFRKMAAWSLERTGWLVCQRCLFPASFSVDVFVLADTIKKSVQPISERVLTSVSFTEHRATHRPGSSDPGSRWCYCWITEGIGQQISRGLSTGRDWHCCVLQNRPNAQRRHQQSFYMQTLQNLGLFHCMLWDAK